MSSPELRERMRAELRGVLIITPFTDEQIDGMIALARDGRLLTFAAAALRHDHFWSHNDGIQECEFCGATRAAAPSSEPERPSTEGEAD